MPKFVLTFHCLNKLFYWSQRFCKFSAFKTFSWSLEQFFLTVGQNNFGNKIPYLEFFLTSLGIGTPIRGLSDFKRNLKQEGKILQDQSNKKIILHLLQDKLVSIYNATKLHNYKCLELHQWGKHQSINGFCDKMHRVQGVSYYFDILWRLLRPPKTTFWLWWRHLCIPEVRSFEFHQPVFKKVT